MMAFGFRIVWIFGAPSGQSTQTSPAFGGKNVPDHHRKGWNEMDHSRWFDKQSSEIYATNSGPMYNITINKDDDPTDEHPSYTLHSG